MREMLPNGWAEIELQDICEVIMGQAPPGVDCNSEKNGTIFVKAGEFSKDFPIVREWTTRPLKLARYGDVLICVVGATCGKLNLASAPWFKPTAFQAVRFQHPCWII
jgi:type I restriction enzyme, S subunit